MLAAALRRCSASVRVLLPRPGAAAPSASASSPAAAAIQSVRCYSHGSHETDEEFDARWVTYFSKPDLDAWELRKGMNTLVGYDLVPEPKIIDAALRACRRLNDFASAVRILEVVKDKAGPHKEIYPYVIQELRPTLDELGISTPEELGLDKA
ncbi:cytochrome c oxidase subunit 5A, mitochondrial [Monodelphis domestica]|uniref:cytochrome c oxidase subunit 5A, mitochondrial n=1 Tax=Monodelphis domestica TaxID=13616 RepID=UPI00005EB098|nr:cytochrome c oxidase subunit 5A, mitochondrial [Monodelphis domestica]